MFCLESLLLDLMLSLATIQTDSYSRGLLANLK